MTKAAEVYAQERRALIQKEIERLGDHQWAGSYYRGDGLALNLSLLIAPQSGFCFEHRGCLGVYDRNVGNMVETKSGSLWLDAHYAGYSWSSIEREFLCARWGPRRYLIPTNDIVDFCNAINAGREPRNEMHGEFYLRVGDEARIVAGTPAIPDQFRAYLLREPIKAQIIAVGETKKGDEGIPRFTRTQITLNVGRADGVLPGMKFQVYEPLVPVGDVKVVSVDERTCIAVVTNVWPSMYSPTAQWKLTTGTIWPQEQEQHRQ